MLKMFYEKNAFLMRTCILANDDFQRFIQKNQFRYTEQQRKKLWPYTCSYIICRTN